MLDLLTGVRRTLGLLFFSSSKQVGNGEITLNMGLNSSPYGKDVWIAKNSLLSLLGASHGPRDYTNT